MKAGIIVYPGTTCDRDTFMVLKEVLGWDVRYIFYKESTAAPELDIIILPGGFSYGDYLRAGALAAMSPVREVIYKHAAAGLPVLGICNGFQILLEMKLLKGALMQNASGRFICRNINLKVKNNTSLLTNGLERGTHLQVPIAHMDGNYYAEEEVLKEMEEKDLVILQYADASGEITEDSNPNGSVKNIAGIRNEAGNVVGLMPHPERAALPYHKSKDGLLLLRSISGYPGIKGRGI